MKILFCASSFRSGVTCLLTEHLCALKQFPAIELLAVSGEGEQEPGLEERLGRAGIPLTRIPGFDEHHNFFQLLENVAACVEKFRPDIVMAQTNWQFILLDLARFKTGCKYPLVYWIHGFRNNNPLKARIALPLIGSVLRFRAQAIIASSQNVLQKFSRWTGEKKIRYLPLGVDPIFFNIAHEPPKTIPAKPFLIFAGQFREGKQQAWIISAVHACCRKGYPVEAWLPGDGPLRQKLEAQVHELGMDKVIHMPGCLTRNELVEFYKKATLAVVPSNDETFGACIAEPLVCKIPLLTRPIGCAVKLIQHDVNGFLFSNQEELQIQLERILTSPELYRKVASNLDAFPEIFSWQNICRKEIALFQELLSV